jgi:hypothetical protein
MKDVKRVVPTGRPSFTVHAKGLPPLHGWALRLLIDISETDYKKGFWMSKWESEFKFDEQNPWVFPTEEEAKQASDAIRDDNGIETEVVKV